MRSKFSEGMAAVENDAEQARNGNTVNIIPGI